MHMHKVFVLFPAKTCGLFRTLFVFGKCRPVGGLLTVLGLLCHNWISALISLQIVWLTGESMVNTVRECHHHHL